MLFRAGKPSTSSFKCRNYSLIEMPCSNLQLSKFGGAYFDLDSIMFQGLPFCCYQYCSSFLLLLYTGLPRNEHLADQGLL